MEERQERRIRERRVCCQSLLFTKVSTRDVKKAKKKKKKGRKTFVDTCPKEHTV